MAKDAIVVLGGGVHEDGSLPKIVQNRVDKGVELFRQGVAQYLILTGYKPYLLDYIPVKTEAQAMKDYAASLGIPEETILLEEKAMDTLSNAYFTKKDVLEPRGWKDITVVTSDFHVPRSEYLFRKVLGSSYTVEMMDAKTDLPDSELEEIIRKEQKRYSFWKKVLAPMFPGADSYAALVIKVGHLFRKVNRRRED